MPKTTNRAKERLRDVDRKKKTRTNYIDTKDYKDDVAAIENGMQALEISAAKLCRMAGISSAALSQSLAGKYTGDTSNVIDQALRALDRLREEQINLTVMPFVQTSVYKTIKYICDEAFANRTTDAIGLITAHVGLGKTTSLKRYQSDNSNVIYLRCSEGMVKKTVLNRLRRELRAVSEGKTISDIQDCVVMALQNTPKLIILDEASKARNDVLECLRDISDDSECGLVYAGREYLFERFSSNEGLLGEISSRILTRIDPLKRLLEDDVHLILEASVLSDATNETKDMILDCCENNGRVLHRLVIKLANWIKKHGVEKLSPEVVAATFQKTVKTRSVAWRNHAI